MMTSTWRPRLYGSSFLPWPCTLDCSTHAECTLLQMLKHGCTWDGTAEGQKFPCHQLQRDKASLTCGSKCQEYGLHCRGREVNKQREKETGHLGKLQTSYLTGSIPPVWHIATDIPSSGSRCHAAQNSCLLLSHCCMPILPWHWKKTQLHWASSCEPLLSASMFILLEMFAIFECNGSWQGGTDTLLLFCQQLALQWLVQTSRV